MSEKLLNFKDISDKLKQFVQDNPDVTNYPITNSNIFQVKEYIEAFTSDLQRFKLPLLWAELRYFENLIKFENDEFLELYGHRIAQQAILNGASAVIKKKDENIILGITASEIDGLGNVRKGKVYLTPWFQGLGKVEKYLFNEYQNKEIKFSSMKDKFAVWKWNSLGITSLFEWLPFIHIITDIINLMNLNVPTSTFRWLVEIRNNSSEIIEAEFERALNNRKSNIIYNIKPNNYDEVEIDGKTVKTASDDIGDSNKWTPIEVKRHPNEFSRADLSIFTNIMNYVSGHFCNISEKRERNIDAEVSTNTSHFAISQEEFLREAKIFVSFYNKAFNANATCKFTFNLADNEILKNQTSTAEGENDNSSNV